TGKERERERKKEDVALSLPPPPPRLPPFPEVRALAQSWRRRGRGREIEKRETEWRRIEERRGRRPGARVPVAAATTAAPSAKPSHHRLAPLSKDSPLLRGMVAVASEHLVVQYETLQHQTLHAKHGARTPAPFVGKAPHPLDRLSQVPQDVLAPRPAFLPVRRCRPGRRPRKPRRRFVPVLEEPGPARHEAPRRRVSGAVRLVVAVRLVYRATTQPSSAVVPEAPTATAGGKARPASGPSAFPPAPDEPPELRVGEPEDPGGCSEAWFTDAESEAEPPKSTQGVARAASCLGARELPQRKLSVNWEVASGRRKSTTAIVDQVAIETAAAGSSPPRCKGDPPDVIARPDLPNCPFRILCRIGSKIRDVASKHRERSASISHISLPDDLVGGGTPTAERTRAEAGHAGLSDRAAKRAGRTRLWAFTSPRSDRRRAGGPGPSRKDSGYASNSSKSPITPPSSPFAKIGKPSNRVLSFSAETGPPKASAKLPPARSDSLRSMHSLAGVVPTDVPPELKARYALRKFIAHEMTTKESNYARNLRELAEVFQGPLAEASARAASAVSRQQARRSSVVKCAGGCPSRCLCKYLHIGCSPAPAESAGAFRSAPSLSPPRPGPQAADFGPKPLPPAFAAPAALGSFADSGLKNPRAMPEWVNKLHATSTELAGDLKEVYRYWTHAES
ncbi:MAG: hypothetical protein BJ554DRAFT_2800, partial [Olpidium bornovanus]